MAKGGEFEREISKLLSRWWSLKDPGGPRDDLFWRTSNSGGRATVRSRSGLQTFGAHGDITPTHPDSMPFGKLLVVECKRGYTKAGTLSDLLERTDSSALTIFEKWIAKADRDRAAVGVPYWLLITRRNGRPALAVLPQRLRDALLALGAALQGGRPRVDLSVPVRSGAGGASGRATRLTAMLLDDFLYSVRPPHIIALVKEMG